MARFPKIDQPCPLDRDGQLRVRSGYCGHCGKVVHRLDGKTDAERADLLRSANGPLCVSYRLAAGMGAALVLSSMAAPASAAQAPAAPVQAPAVAPPADHDTSAGSEYDTPGHLELIFVGGIDKPGEAEWIDDGDLPGLPVRAATARDLD
ncbi:MAG: hypothetical protein KIS72_00835 [Luteimonas sp.]|nr:hypothetical protein [Luteimonas sp.]